MIFAWFLRRRRIITRLISTDLGGKEAAYKPLVSDKEINGYLRLFVGLTWACMEMVMKSISLCLFVCCSGINAEAGGWPFVFDKELRTKREGKEKKGTSCTCTILRKPTRHFPITVIFSLSLQGVVEEHKGEASRLSLRLRIHALYSCGYTRDWFRVC